MREERLEEIKKSYNFWMEEDESIGLLPEDIEWLIEQTERVHELEKDVEEWETVNESWEEINTSLVEQNKRYREALEEIARGRFPGASYKARQALEGEE